MRKILGARLIFSLTAIAAIGVWAACGGSDPQDVVQTDAGSDAGGDKDTSPPDNDSGGNKDTGAPDTGPPQKEYDAGPPIVLDGGDFEGGIPCVVGGELELEPNDDKLTANDLKPTRCGVVLVSDGGVDGGESDWLTFQLGDASTNFYVQYAGNVKVLVETDGQAPVDITTGGKLNFAKGQPYHVQVRSADGKTQTWRVTLFQE